ncbi:hypothetical protein [Nocardioides sp. P86]|uniref:hypothetical protein n=1 Tax=Nocardioides sp. P86 TaxID=2939569 RepID=UPI00203C8459|nr:hypothetical protein [Nocardioides sp. P86]
MKLQEHLPGRTDRGFRFAARPVLLGALVIATLAVLVPAPASASTAQGTGGGSVGGFGWSFLIPAAVIGLVVLGALLATRVERSPGPDPVLDDAEPTDEDTERPHEDPPA